MDKKAYLNRIGLSGSFRPTIPHLHALHESHVLNIPFENLDIHFNKEIVLTRTKIHKKVVDQGRGGFCYELNYLFSLLLKEIGYSCKIISARIFDSNGKRGPMFDHMAILVRHQLNWLVDVGFGDLFLKPIALLMDQIQTDGRNFFKICKYNSSEFVLLMSADGISFEKKYTFSSIPQLISSFKGICNDKQVNTNSYFVQNLVCTKPTKTGRITIFNNKFIEREPLTKKETRITTDIELYRILERKFNITINPNEILKHSLHHP
jgi:N-hydroxyarylamine O-acetyltransferase